MKFWESMESNKRWQGGGYRRETGPGTPQKLVIDRMLQQKLPDLLGRKQGREGEEVEQETDSASSSSSRTQDQTFPCLPRY